MDLEYVRFADVDINDPFFDSLKMDYAEFEMWFARKANDYAYVFNPSGQGIEGFLYLKVEDEGVSDVQPPLPVARRIKVGTLKINPHGTRLGERFVKKIFDHAIGLGVSEVYVTVFEKHEALVLLLKRYGFCQKATKTTANGVENVLVKSMASDEGGILDRYPLIKIGDRSVYLLSLYPKWHTRLLPGSILKNESASIVQDVSHTNSIHKVYLAAMDGVQLMRPGDIVLIYRTSDGVGSARFRSVVTSVCVVEEYRHIKSFASQDDFVRYCSPYSVFDLQELKGFWCKPKYPHVLRFTYNYALPRRVIRGKLIDEMGFSENAYWGVMRVSKKQLRSVLVAGGLNENLVVD